MAGEKWKKLWLDSILDSFTFGKLADSAKAQYQRHQIKYLDWVWAEKREEKVLKENIKKYIEGLGETKSGENVYTWKSILVTLFKEELEECEVDEIDRTTQIITREANRRNPVKRHLADAVSFAELVRLIEASRTVDRSPVEEIALDIFVIAFCTMSRAGKVARL